MTSIDTADKPAIVLDPSDDVVVALRALAVGERVELGDRERVTVIDEIPAGHKFARRAMTAGQPVRKYGTAIGTSSTAIEIGAHVHTHNVDPVVPPRLSSRDATAGVVAAPPSRTSFRGFRRAAGAVGTRNYVGILTTVNCSATVARAAARRLNDALASDPRATANGGTVDGVVALTQRSGCAVSDESLVILRRTLAGYAAHPNFGAVIVVGLGCETNQIGPLQGLIDPTGERPVVFLNIQDAGGTTSTIAAITEAVEALLPSVAAAARGDEPVASLILGNECGGSDGYSGVTANPVMGAAGDLIAAAGGAFAFSETPEIHGAEHLLFARAASDGVSAALTEKLDWWAGYIARSGGSLDNNPSPGNKAGGITTIYEKSLGAMAKGGRLAPLNSVVGYAEPIAVPGLSFMDTPGYDPVSVTGLIAGGANVICFSTGRGSVFGSKPTPSIKVATNSDLARRMPDDMDFDAGIVLRDGNTVESAALALYEQILDVASGRQTCSEVHGFGDEEFVPWDVGPTM